MKKTLAELCQVLPETHRRRLKHFHDDESGSMIVFTLFIIVLMLIVGGMAVDFMRFESRRAMMQGAVDSAVLAAADLDQQGDPKDIVEDYVTKSQAGNCLSSEVIVDDSAVNYRSVTAECELVMNTFFLKLIGMNQLTASAESTAIEGVGDIEISLVIDISGSMAGATSSGGTTKIAALRSASTAFVDALLLPEFEDKISISLVPYSEHVNVGEELYGTLNTETKHGWSHCVEMPVGFYSQTGWSNSTKLTQMPHFQIGDGSLDRPICPRHDYETVIPLSQDADALRGAIAQIQPRVGTAIYMGMKWGVTLLDPSFNANLQALPSGMIDEAFADRPAPYPDPDNRKSNDTFKYLVLMTDGMNSNRSWIYPELYDDPNEIAHWNDVSFVEFLRNTTDWNNIYEYYQGDYITPTTGNQYLASICGAAGDAGIIIFGVGVYDDESTITDPDALEEIATGRAALQGCVGSPNNYFETSGDELTAIFEAIADQITDLRLTL